MGLFDDILKKPTTNPMPPADPLAGASTAGQGGTSGSGDDGTPPIIVKTEASTVFGPQSESEALKASLPLEPLAHAEEDYSSVLVKVESVPTPIVSNVAVSPSAEGTTPVPEMVAIADMTPATPVVPPATLEPTGIQASGTTPLSTEAPTPIVDALAPNNNDTISIPQEPSLFDHIMSDTPLAPVAEPVLAVPTPSIEASSIFGGTTEETKIESTPIAEATPVMTVSAEGHGNFSTPREFIEKSLASIALMLENIDKRHSTKKGEEEGYRKEKMRFAELEKNAYVEAEIMDRERDHALRMQSMFQSELDTDTANREKKVHHTEAKHEEKHTKKKHEMEEEILMAS